MVRLELADKDNKDFLRLCCMLDENLDEIVCGRFDRSRYMQYNTVESMACIVIAYKDSEAVGCAAIREYRPDIAEVKRVFVKPAFRCRGISAKLMDELEEQARGRGYGRLILETGELLAASMRLYQSRGFERITNYGPYADMTDSVCMGKQLV